MKPLVVMKFGGTSVEDAVAIDRTAGIVRGRVERGLQPIVVVSAMAKVTDQLIAAAQAAARGDRNGALAITARLRNRHLETAGKLVPAEAIGEVEGWMETEFAALDEILRGLSAVGELTPRIHDMVVSYGERISSRMIAAGFAHRGLSSAHVDARRCIITDAQHGRGIPQDALIEERLREHVLPHAQEGRVVVMGGFIGSTVEGVTTTLGRGGSDFTAALVGGGLEAESIEIWTDVNGIMTTDPRMCPDALRVKTISFEEAAELAYFGAKVLHPATILPAVKKNIPVLVLNSRNPQNEGTRITAVAPHCRSPFKSIAVKKKLTIIDVVASRMLMSHGYLKAIFDIFDKHKCAVDMVSTSEVSVSLTVDSNEKLPEIAADLSKLADVKYEGKKALVCLVGENVRGHNGIAGRVFTAVKDVNLRMISQGASEINMSFMIEEDDVEEAVRALHAEFFADADPEIFDLDTVSKTQA
ncbi:MULTISPECIES: lysine-sensitive aspartokinase 3 [Acidobacterium]|uniref:Aspartokinase n=1 Tax=Acidobacterium capsulatum (strain ATCC 51196 / DSM 11244 / BCRC 80197 / JCM 7670 / NBRC 15755 / NCIMB 13165 / 161) TaxID=240015 RepID=C1F655_ACIC5|nr:MULTISPECIES: lysine-sensitive aspartokinase 3 [Acidobacterium]ACO33167.1 aspartate kinase [Acidobacterium capsulatum ATCC 51196]HCT60852.1 lysine-sensitive aspartokinase 3 [Acidobacterium sp.]